MTSSRRRRQGHVRAERTAKAARRRAAKELLEDQIREDVSASRIRLEARAAARPHVGGTTPGATSQRAGLARVPSRTPGRVHVANLGFVEASTTNGGVVGRRSRSGPGEHDPRRRRHRGRRGGTRRASASRRPTRRPLTLRPAARRHRGPVTNGASTRGRSRSSASARRRAQARRSAQRGGRASGSSHEQAA